MLGDGEGRRETVGVNVGEFVLGLDEIEGRTVGCKETEGFSVVFGENEGSLEG